MNTIRRISILILCISSISLNIKAQVRGPNPINNSFTPQFQDIPVSQVRNPSYNSRDPFDLDDQEYTVKKIAYTNTERVTTFSPYFNDCLIDSFWHEFRTINKKNIDSNANPIIDFKVIDKTYLTIFKAMYGDSFLLPIESKTIRKDTIQHKQLAEILCKASSSKTKGFLDIKFNITKDHKITLKKIAFFPVDHLENSFVTNLCENELILIKTQRLSALLDTVAQYADADEVKKIKEVRRSLETLKLPENPLFNTRLFMENKNLWVVGIFDTNNADERLLLGYKFINKKFKPALAEVIKKGG